MYSCTSASFVGGTVRIITSLSDSFFLLWASSKLYAARLTLRSLCINVP